MNRSILAALLVLGVMLLATGPVFGKDKKKKKDEPNTEQNEEKEQKEREKAAKQAQAASEQAAREQEKAERTRAERKGRNDRKREAKQGSEPANEQIRVQRRTGEAMADTMRRRKEADRGLKDPTAKSLPRSARDEPEEPKKSNSEKEIDAMEDRIRAEDARHVAAYRKLQLNEEKARQMSDETQVRSIRRQIEAEMIEHKRARAAFEQQRDDLSQKSQGSPGTATATVRERKPAPKVRR